MDIKELSRFHQLLVTALDGSPKGLALITQEGKRAQVLWANKSFFKIAGLDEHSALEGGMLGVWASLGGARADLAAALDKRQGWEGCLGSEALGKIKAHLESVDQNEAILWLEREMGSDSLRERLEAALKKVKEISSVDEKTGIGGPKSFWRSVGAVWAVCSRSELPVSLGLFSLNPSALDGGDYEEIAKKALGKTFRRASDVIGRLGQNSYAVFVVGQNADMARARLEMLLNQIGSQGIGSVGLACGIPENGSSTQSIKTLAKKLQGASLSSHGALEFSTF